MQLEPLLLPMTTTLFCVSLQYPVPLVVKNTFLHFDIKVTNSRKRAASAPAFGIVASSPRGTNALVVKRRCETPMKDKRLKEKINDVDDDDVLREYTTLARAEAWVHISHSLIRHGGIAQKRFTLSKRQFFNATPWLNCNDVVHARKNKILRVQGTDTLELWASDFALWSGSVSKLIETFTLLTKLIERCESMLILPNNATITFTPRRGMHLDTLRAKVKEELKIPFNQLRFFCRESELRGSCFLRDFDVRPGDVIRVVVSKTEALYETTNHSLGNRIY